MVSRIIQYRRSDGVRAGWGRDAETQPIETVPAALMWLPWVLTALLIGAASLLAAVWWLTVPA